MQSNVLQSQVNGLGSGVIEGVLVEDEPMPDAEARPEDGIELEAKGNSTLGLVELLLKWPAGVDELNRRAAWQRELFPRFLLIGETSFLVYALIMVLLLNLAPVAAYPHSPWLLFPPASWSDGTALGLVLAYTLGPLLAAGICLPSFYFNSLLAGVKISWLQISSLVGKGTAANAVLLLGILPIYVAIVLGLVVFQAPNEGLQWALQLGLALPFLSGLWGLRAIYLGILDIGANQPSQWQCRRQCFLRRLTLSWTAVYTAVVPVMIYRLWGFFADLVQIG